MNPFKKDNQILPIASINSVYVNGQLASDLFRPQVIINEIKKHHKKLKINHPPKIGPIVVPNELKACARFSLEEAVSEGPKIATYGFAEI